jgi:hypothetical protein
MWRSLLGFGLSVVLGVFWGCTGVAEMRVLQRFAMFSNITITMYFKRDF